MRSPNVALEKPQHRFRQLRHQYTGLAPITCAIIAHSKECSQYWKNTLKYWSQINVQGISKVTVHLVHYFVCTRTTVVFGAPCILTCLSKRAGLSGRINVNKHWNVRINGNSIGPVFVKVTGATSTYEVWWTCLALMVLLSWAAGTELLISG